MAPSREEILALATSDVRNAIPQETLLPLITTSPFIPSKSLFNLRDVGAVPGSAIPAGRVFRTGALAQAAQDPEALTWLQANVKKIFDLRRGSEREAAPDPELQGVENVWYATEGKNPAPDLTAFAAADGAEAWADQLMIVASSYKPVIRELLRHVRDHPQEPFLFHCTAGRDRTGLVAGLLNQLAGTAQEDIVYDYLLSRLGTEPVRDKLVKIAMINLGIDDIETPGFANIVDLRAEYWLAFHTALQEEYGSWDGYVTKGLGFSAEDLDTIKKNLRS
ncbi:Tyrosine-protein phosphatase-like protein [Emericellopsis cladophorae]|uniref:Tyrosine-protein phosphatase-like protein n=1 Tax=Emericellopsis cladophorae TaxID=2686198 RepID=A0A9P9Y6W5_9HYPO|nr:Tyrosine-protein phosphatase-like protein [Emericellopsis cladophorae]KAI6784435.1 Tyrosine-protein phosphatase-like protein [Emericellopsis cladophorae]